MNKAYKYILYTPQNTVVDPRLFFSGDTSSYMNAKPLRAAVTTRDF